MLNSKEIEFILKNEGREIYKLILETSKIKGESSIDYKRCIKIIEAREKIKKKIPLWAE